MIVPINISYSHLRNGDNFLIEMAQKLIGQIGSHFKEELEIESNIVLNSKITIRILEPISTKSLLGNLDNNINSPEKTINSIRYEATQNIMNKIYESLTINFDHIFTLILFLYPKKAINIEYFKRLIYITLFKIKEHNLFYDESIYEDLIYLISYEKHKFFDEILEIAIKNKIIINDDVDNNFFQ